MKPFLEIPSAGGAYGYYLGENLLERIGQICDTVSKASSRILVTSPVVQHLFGERVARALGSSTPVLLVPDGEEAKSLETVDRLVAELLSAGARRDSLIVAMGGGAVGDTAGFVASIYLRGVDLLHVPTTLLAQVDSSVGGKVAVNHRMGKNLIGSFYPPRAVVADLRTLAVLPPHELRSGLFEALKTGVIADAALFDLIEGSPDALRSCDLRSLARVVRASVAVKADVVSTDEREGGHRRLLNYGHTIGHGIEAALEYRGITHGDAIAWGMLAADSIAIHRGLLSPSDGARIESAILALGPAIPPALQAADILPAIEHDKKFIGGRRVMVLPRRIGECVVVEDIGEDEIRAAVGRLADEWRTPPW